MNRKNHKSGLTRKILRIVAYMKPYWLLASVGILLLFANVYFNIKTVLIIKVITDAIAAKDFNKVSSLIMFYVPYSLFFIFLMCIGNFIRGYVQNLVGRDVCVALFEKINQLEFSVVQGSHSGDLVTRVNKDVDQAVGLIGRTIYSLLENSFVCIAAFGYLTTLDIKLAFLVLLTGPLTFLVSRVFDGKMRSTSRQVQDKGGEVRSVLQEFLQGMPVVRSFNMEHDFHDRFIESRNKQLAYMKKNTWYNVVMWRIVIFTNVASMLIIVYFVSLMTIHGALTAGSSIAFIFLMGRVQWPFINIAQNWGNVQQSYGAAERIFEILDRDSEGQAIAGSNSKNVINNDDDALCFNGVSFTYKTSEENAEDKAFLNNINIKVGKGKVVALVGPSGSGKTTLARLCCGLYLPDAGDITLFNKSILRDLKAVRSDIAYVPQNPYLFAGTIRENISYGRENASDIEIYEAAKSANAHEFIEKLENGYDTVLGERGVSLSGGQRQRISIARAFLRKAQLVILDEATSALDNESEYLVQQSMDKLMQGRTVLVIAHRLSTIRNADSIVVMNNGEIVEQGTHEELMNLSGLYSELYNIQFGSQSA